MKSKPPVGLATVGDLFDALVTSTPQSARSKVGGALVLVPLEPWLLQNSPDTWGRTLTGRRKQLIRTTIGRHAPALSAMPFPLPDLPSVTLGRSHEATIRIDQPTISRIHAELVFQSGHCKLNDRGSYNGTLVNGKVVGPGEKFALSDGDVVTLGEAQLLFGSLEHFAKIASGS